MKKQHALMLALAMSLALQLNGQQLITGNSDVVGLTYYPYFNQLIESGPEHFFWIASTYLCSVDHPMLTGVVNDYSHIYFIKYDKNGDALYSNYIRGTNIPRDAFSYGGGLTVIGFAYEDVTSNTGVVVPINNAYRMAFLAQYDAMCQFVKMVPACYFTQTQSASPFVRMDPVDGSIFLVGVSDEPLNVYGHGDIGSDLGHFLYVLKYDRNLNLVKVFTAGFESVGEYGLFNNHLTLISDNRGGIIVSGTYEGDRAPIIGENTLASAGFETQGVFAFYLDAELNVVWARDGKIDGFDYNGYSVIFKGFTLGNGDLVMVGGTTTGYFSLGAAEITFENGSGFLNHFVFRVSSDGKVKWIRPYETMAESQGEKKGAQRVPRTREVQSDKFSEWIPWDALQWNEEILYMTGEFMSDSFEVAGRKLEKPFTYGVFVTATDLNSGEELWGYAVSSDYIGLNGIDADAGGNVSLMGYTDSLKYYEFLGNNSVSASQPVFHLGLSYEGLPLWNNNAVMQGVGYGGYGTDLLVLRDGQVFSALGKYVPDLMEVGGAAIGSVLDYSGMLVALDAGNLLGGTLLTFESKPVASGYLRAYKRTASGAYPMVDSIPVTKDGSYEFQSLYPGKYIVQAVAEKNSYPDAVPTYSGGAVIWNDAKIVEIEADTKFRSHYINVANLPKLTEADGSGQMGGTVSYEDETDLGKGTLGKPATNRSVVLKRKASQQQKSTLEDEIVAYVETDDQGNYVFNHVPDGNYVLYVDITGLPMIQNYDVVIVGDKIVSGLDFVVKKNGIEATNTLDIEAITRNAFSVYPNPANDILTIEFPGSGSYNLRIYDAAGSLVESRHLPYVNGPVIMDVSSWNRGIYLIEIVGTKERKTVKFVRD